MNDDQKVSILIAEYNALRAETLAARSYVAQAIGITAAVLMGVIAFTFSTNFSGPKWAPWSMAAVALAYLALTVVWNEINTRRFTSRLRALETDINARAGEQLLAWETKFGWGGLVIPRDPDVK
jgi:protein-S-isoprenylcysteine O-methyltransferase Ste14